ncbi:hypothetical protein H0N95_02725 [Candidatus Micrarchaeota archaeon]|nr:hypothetical protein [Candidatus Micrarchaeota archaeon]
MTLMDFDKKQSNYQQLKKANASELELRVIFSFIHALEPKETLMNIEETPRVITEAFSPTIKEPDVEVTDKMTREYSMWYKPIVYYPMEEKTKASMPELIVTKGKQKCLYNIDEAMLKSLKTYDFLTSSMIRDLSIRLISKLNPIQVVLFARETFTVEDINEAKDAAFFLKPARLILASAKYLPENIKANIPLNAFLVENADMNTEKLRETVKKIM